MTGGLVIGAVFGGLLAGVAPVRALKLGLGANLSAARTFRMLRAHVAARGAPP